MALGTRNKLPSMTINRVFLLKMKLSLWPLRVITNFHLHIHLHEVDLSLTYTYAG
jgi:hypothetical protein